MKVEISCESPRLGGERFTTGESLKGVVTLILKHEEVVSRIAVSLRGILFARVVAKSTNAKDTPLQAIDKHKLFESSDVPFPRTTQPSLVQGYTLPKGRATFPFDFHFPTLSTCKNKTKASWIHHHQTCLPPSFQIISQKKESRAEAKYFLEVVVHRPGAFKNNLTCKQEIVFLPADPWLPPPMLQGTTGSNTQIARIKGGVGIALEVSLPSPAVLYLGREIPLQLAVVTEGNNAAGTSVPSMKLDGLIVAIRTETTITVGPNASMVASTKELVHLKRLNLQLEEVNNVRIISSDIVRGAVIANICPSFTTCTVMQQHVLVVEAGVVLGTDTTIHVLKAEVNIEIHSGIRPVTLNAFDNSPSIGSGEEEIFIPWRIGSERHLGISRQPSGTTSEPPPPY